MDKTRLTSRQKARAKRIFECFTPEYADGRNQLSYRFVWKGKVYYRIAGVKKFKSELRKVIPKTCIVYEYMDNLFSDWYSGETILSYTNGLFGDVLLGTEAFNAYRKDVLDEWKPHGRARYFGLLQADFERHNRELRSLKYSW